MREYDYKEIEKKWQEKWAKDNIFKTENEVAGKENYYVLSMLPYPQENYMLDMLETIL